MEWDHPLLFSIQQRVRDVGHQLRVHNDTIERFMTPVRALVVTVPCRRDDNRVENFIGYRVHHNVALGPCYGAMRMQPNYNLGAAAGYAMRRTLMASLLRIPFGGSAGGIDVNPVTLSRTERQRLIRRYVSEIINFIGPDQDIIGSATGTSEQEMAWVMDTYSQMHGHCVPACATGKPKIIGGVAHHAEAVGRSVVLMIEEASQYLNRELDEMSGAVLIGFGQTGATAARHLHKRGVRITGVSDITGGIFNSRGLDLDALLKHVNAGGRIDQFKGGDATTDLELFGVECDVLIPSAPNVHIDDKVAAKFQCRIIAEVAGGVFSAEADKAILENEDILLIPDILAGSGDTVMGYFEWVQGLQSFFWNDRETLGQMSRILREAFREVVNRKDAAEVDLRTAAYMLAVERLAQATTMRGLFP